MPNAQRDGSGGRDLLAPLGTLVALALPFFAFTVASGDAAHEVKVAAQAGGAVLVLLGLALGAGGRGEATPPAGGRAVRVVRRALAAFLALFAASFAASLARGLDPFGALALLPALALFAWGATRDGESSSTRALSLLVACGAVTGLLAALQRFGGVLRLPIEAPESRFFATALIGNPGDVGAALVVPALLAAASLARGERLALSGVALASCLAGLAAAATLAPVVAFAAGVAVLVARDPRRRLLPASAAAVAALGILAAGGVLSRAAGKVAAGDVGTLTTQRDIGVLSASESIRSHPLLGVGPGGFASDFVRARLAAEGRVRRRLVHLSTSAHFDNAHCDPLTVAAEAGLPAALALAVALSALLAGLLGAARREATAPSPGLVPAEALLAGLAAVLVLSLANFPIQIVPVSGPFAYLAGLAFSRAGGRPPSTRSAFARGALALVALLLAAGSAVRLASALALARSEAEVTAARATSGPDRAGLLDLALGDARRAVALRPRRATARLALGSALAARGDVAGAAAEMRRSLALEERAETLLNLGRLAVARGDLEAARPYFVRAVWVMPRLAPAVPPAGDPDAVVAETARLETALAAGGAPPALPPGLRSR